MQDNFEIRGEVTLLRDDGEVLLNKKNMIVKLGRQAVFNAFFNGSSNNLDKIKLAYSEQLSIVTQYTAELDGTIQNISTNTLTTLADDKRVDPNNIFQIQTRSADGKWGSNVNISTEINPLYRKIDADNLTATYYLYLMNVNNVVKFNNLGLFYSNGDQGSTLFSRLNCEDITIESNRKYCLKYTIYF